MIRFDSLLGFIAMCCSFSACAKQGAQNVEQATQQPPRPARERPAAGKPSLDVAWGIPRFFEIGRQVQLDADSPTVDTTAWPDAVLRSTDAPSRAYLSGIADDQSRVFIYRELDPRRGLRRYALVVPEPKTFSTNGVVTAFWGGRPQFMNLALEDAHSFANFSRKTPNGSEHVVPLRSRLSPSGVNPQEIENVYELEDSRLAVYEHKGLIPGEPLSFSEFTIYDRDTTTDDAELVPVDRDSLKDSLSVALTPLHSERWLRRESFELGGYRVVLVSDAAGGHYFLATPLEFRPGWGFGETTTDLTLAQFEASARLEGTPGSAAALTLDHVSHAWFLSGKVRDSNELPSLLGRGARFLAQLQSARQSLVAGAAHEFAVQAAHALIAAHRSHRDPKMFTRFAHGDAPQPSNSAVFSAGLRYGQDLASALRGLISVERFNHDADLVQAIGTFADTSLRALMPSGATLVQHFDQLALLAEHDENSGRSDVFLDNGSVAIAINHRRLLCASSGTHSPGVTWGAFGTTIDGQSSSVDDPGYSFNLDGGSLPRATTPQQTKLGVSRLFASKSAKVQIRETAQVLRDLPATSVLYQVENRSAHSATLDEARIMLADFLEYGSGENERSQNHYGLGHTAGGVQLPIGFWMEGMRAPLWGNDLAAGEVDLSEQYRNLGSRFILVFGFDRAQIYFLTQPADRLILHNGPNATGLTGLEVRYRSQAKLAPQQGYDVPEVLSYTLRAPLQSVDGDAIPDQLQELAPLWTDIVSNRAHAEAGAASSLDTDSGHGALAYSWALAADLLGSVEPSASALVGRLEQSALRAADFALNSVEALRNQSDFLPTYANGHDYGFHLALFDWAYRETCDVRYRDALLSLADDLARPSARGGLQIGDRQDPSYGGYLSTQQARASGATTVGDQGIRLWALRLAYERTGAPKYRRSAELFIDHWLRLDSAAHSFTGTVLVRQAYRDAGIAQERSPLGHYAVLAGLKAWSDVLPRARALYSAGLAAATGRHVVYGVGLAGPVRLLVPDEGIADFSDEAELDGSFLWATTLEPSTYRGRFAPQCQRRLAVGTR